MDGTPPYGSRVTPDHYTGRTSRSTWAGASSQATVSRRSRASLLVALR